jgi:hypothetical protein
VDRSDEPHKDGRWPTNAIIEAARRYKEAFDASVTRATLAQATTPVDIIEMHQATLGLMWATHTKTLQEALKVLNDGHGSTD